MSLTGGNRNDITQLMPLIQAIPPVRGRRGRPRRRLWVSQPASPSRLNRPIQWRKVAGWQSGSTAICDAANTCANSSTITARAASPLAAQISSPQPFDLAA